MHEGVGNHDHDDADEHHGDHLLARIVSPGEIPVFLMSRRQVHAALAAAGAYLGYLAAAEAGSRRPVRVGGLIALGTLAFAGMVTSKSSAKALVVENRLNDMLNNGFSTGGNLTVQGVHNAAGGLQIKGTSFTLNHGTVGVPGGGPLVYSPSYASAQSAAIANLQNKLSSSNIL